MADADRDEAHAPASKVAQRVGLACLFVIVLAVYGRLYYGVDFTDESFYAALPWSFTLGHRPWLDELAIHQLAAQLTTPFVAGWVWLKGDQQGLVLFLRHLYLVWVVLCAVAAGRLLRPVAGPIAAALLAGVAIAWVPFLIPSPSYNTLSSFGLLGGCALLALAGQRGGRPWHAFAGTGLLAVTSIAYPPLVAAAGTGLAMGARGIRLLDDASERRARRIAILLAGAFAVLGVAAAFLRYGGLTSIRRILEHSARTGTQGGGLWKLDFLAEEVASEGIYLGALVLCVLVLATTQIATRRGILAWLGAALFGPALIGVSLLYRGSTEPFTTTTFVLSTIALASPLGRQEDARKVWNELTRDYPKSFWAGQAAGKLNE